MMFTVIDLAFYVTLALCRSVETYFVIREDGTEIRVTILNGSPMSDKKELTDEEIQWFADGNHKKLKEEH